MAKNRRQRRTPEGSTSKPLRKRYMTEYPKRILDVGEPWLSFFDAMYVHERARLGLEPDLFVSWCCEEMHRPFYEKHTPPKQKDPPK